MSEQRRAVSHGDDEDAVLASLGYTSEFKREMSFWGNFSLGFTYLSPVVGVYTLFGFALATGGGPMIWAVVLAAVGQLLVALVFGEVVSQYPVSGGIYPWTRRLWGRRWAWMAGWIYMLALVVTISSVSYGAGPFVAILFGFEPSTNITILCALGLIALVTVLNFGGTRLLAKVAFFGFAAELAGAVVVGGWLLLTERHQGLGVMFDTSAVVTNGSYLPAFLAAALLGVYLYYGFEACGDVAEEVKNPRVQIPKSMRMTIYIGGFASFFITFALLLSVPDIGAVISGADPDPVTTILSDAFGPVGFRFVIGIVLISFFSCALSLQAAGSRLIYSYARDQMMPGSSLLSRFSVGRAVPPYALLLAAAVPALIVIGSKVSEDALTKIVSFAALGIYLGFMMVVLAALRARFKGWQPSGKFRLGRMGMPVTIAAFAYQLLAAVNMAWPRTPESAWYDNYIVLLSAVIVVGAGLVYMAAARPYLRKDAPHGDAIPALTGTAAGASEDRQTEAADS
ncbi:MAG: APC family permease [Humibacillus sp.]|nr:APC family permease [Humibacillus sp.]MDN5777390.1 APC family permease [Humibacillus sp.]